MKTKVTIDGPEQVERGTSKNGKAFEERFQQAYLHEPGKKFPTSCKLPLWDGARPYAPGDYETDQQLEVSEFNRLHVVREIALTPLPASK
jgi:hypothetical protein